MSKKRILVVDDEPDFVMLVKKYLEKAGFQVEMAFNGVEALEKVHANPPDGMVLDVMMPEKTATRCARNSKGMRSTPIFPLCC